MAEYQYTREKLSDGSWDVNHPERVDATGSRLTLRGELLAAGVEASIQCDGTQVLVTTNSARGLVDPVVAAHKSNTLTAEMLAALKDAKYLEMRAQVNAFIVHPDRYPYDRQNTLTNFQMEASRLGLINRYAYIQAGWDWAGLVITYYYQCKGAVAAAQSKAAVDAVELDLAQFEAGYPVTGDPQITIPGALAIED